MRRTFLTGRCLPYGDGITFWPLREVIRQATGGHDAPDKIEALLDGQADAAEVAARLSLALGPGNGGRLDGAEIFWAARRLFEALARSRPLLVVFEDLHWAESTFLDLVESLAVQHGRSPVVLVCVARPELIEQRPAWAAEAARALTIELAPLAEGAAAALLDSLAGDQRIPPATQARLLETAAGNPLYLEQLTAALSEHAGTEIWPVLPPTIQALLGARLQRLGPGASSVLARAAVIGKDFGIQAVRELLPPEARGPLSRNLQTLVAKGLVEHQPSDRRPAEEYSFRHILIQEAAYRAIPKSLRAELHHRFADWLEYVFWQPATARPEILGHHLEQSVRYLSELRPAEAASSPLPRRAAGHLEAAGRAAHDRGDALAAMNLLIRAAALLPHDDAALARLYTSLGTAMTEAGQLEEAVSTLDDAQRIAAANGDEGQRAHAQVQALLSGLELVPNRAAEEIAQALPGLRSQFARGPDELGLCRVQQLQAAMHWIHASSAAAEEAWQRAAGYARRANDRQQLAEILGWLASAALWGPTPAAEGIRRCKDYLDEIGNHPRGQAVILWHIAGLYAMQDQVEMAQTTLSLAKSHLDILGPTMTATETQPAAFIAMLAGDPVTAEIASPLRIRSAQPNGRERFPIHHSGAIGQGHRGARWKPVRRSQPADRDKPGGCRRRGTVSPDPRPRIVGQDPVRPRPPYRGSGARSLGSGTSGADGSGEPACRCLARSGPRHGNVRPRYRSTGRGDRGPWSLPAQGQPSRSPGITQVPYPACTYSREDLLMPYSAVPRAELNQDGTINLIVRRQRFRAW